MTSHPYKMHVTVAPQDAARARAALRGGGRVVCVVNHPDIPDAFTCQVEDHLLAEAAVAQAEVLAAMLRAGGVAVLRVKVGTVPWNLEAPHLYWETHLRVAGAGDQLTLSEGEVLCRGALLSCDAERDRRWVTVRTRRDDVSGVPAAGDPFLYVREHCRRTHGVVTNLVRLGVAVVRPPEAEAVVYDSAPEHDARWEGRT
jgi:hypothetical protein